MGRDWGEIGEWAYERAQLGTNEELLARPGPTSEK